MRRRHFLGLLAAGVATATAAPLLKFVPALPALPEPIPEPVAEPIIATISEWNNYANFSTFAIAAAIDPAVTEAALELAYRLELETNTLCCSIED